MDYTCPYTKLGHYQAIVKILLESHDKIEAERAKGDEGNPYIIEMEKKSIERAREMFEEAQAVKTNYRMA